jgi:serine/threonine-protein kinase
MEGESAFEAYADLERESRRLRDEAETLLALMRPWDSTSVKKPAWAREHEGKRLGAEAARALAKSEAAFTRALGRVPSHRGARAGLAKIHFSQFEHAEVMGDAEQMARHLDLARAYDDGALALELADEGELIVDSEPGVSWTLQRYDSDGLVLTPSDVRMPSASTSRIKLPSGSYRIRLQTETVAVYYPLVVQRARRHRLSVRIASSSVPEGMRLVLGGPAKLLLPRATKLSIATLPSFAIAAFPVTFAEYARFLNACRGGPDFERRTPGHGLTQLLDNPSPGVWRLANFVEGPAAARIEGRELELPVIGVNWYDAVAYARWLSVETGLPYRLPTDLEWEKAMRGADGRAFPMGNHLDPSFAKLRESRPEASQPEPIGAFSMDESPYGVRDLAGGVGDWTCTMVDGKQAPRLEDEGRKECDERQAFWRGGTWSSSATARGMRYPMKLTQRTSANGFRVALDVHEPTPELVVEPMKG